MRNRGAFEPQGDAAFGCGAGFHVVDDKGGLFLMVHVEPGFVAGDDDLHVNPSRGHDVDVGLVTRRCLFAQGGPRVLWVRDILCGVVAALLIVTVVDSVSGIVTVTSGSVVSTGGITTTGTVEVVVVPVSTGGITTTGGT